MDVDSYLWMVENNVKLDEGFWICVVWIVCVIYMLWNKCNVVYKFYVFDLNLIDLVFVYYVVNWIVCEFFWLIIDLLMDEVVGFVVLV